MGLNAWFDRLNYQIFLNKMKTQEVAAVKFRTYSLILENRKNNNIITLIHGNLTKLQKYINLS